MTALPRIDMGNFELFTYCHPGVGSMHMFLHLLFPVQPDPSGQKGRKVPELAHLPDWGDNQKVYLAFSSQMREYGAPVFVSMNPKFETVPPEPLLSVMFLLG